MTVTLYKYTGEENRVDKTGFLSSGLLLSDVIIKGAFNVVSPSLVISYPGDLSGYNYAACTFDGSTFYYYVKITGEIGGRITADLKRDPLYSFKAQIMECNGVANRTRFSGETDNINLFVPDNDLQMFQYTEECAHIVGSFSSGWTAGAYVCTVG